MTHIPVNWQVVRKEGKNLIYRCPITFGNGTQRCTFTARKQRLEKHIEDGKHIFEKIQTPERTQNHTEPKELIEKAVFEFAARAQLSLQTLSGVEMKHLICSIVKHSCDYIIHSGPQVFDPNTFFPGFSRNTARNKMIKYGMQNNEDHLKNFRIFSKFASFAVDAGTVYKHHMLEFLLCNPSSGYRPEQIYSTEFTESTAENFVQSLEEAVKCSKKFNFNIVAIVADNVMYQRSPLAHWDANSYINRSEDPSISSLIYIPCCCHIINLCLTQMLKENKLFKNVAEASNLLATLSRKKKYLNYFNSTAPTIPVTRWLYLFDFTEWIIRNEHKIKYLIQNIDIIITDYDQKQDKYGILANIEFIDFIKINRLLKPLRFLSDSFESDRSTLSCVVPLVEYCAQQIRSLMDFTEIFTADDHQTIKLLYCIFIARFRQTSVPDILCLAYSLTAEGRYSLFLRGNLPEDEQIQEENYFRTTGNGGLIRLVDNPPDIDVEDYKSKYKKLYSEYMEAIDCEQGIGIKQFKDEVEFLLEKNMNEIKSVFEDKYVIAKKALSIHLTKLRYLFGSTQDIQLKKIKKIKSQFTQFFTSKDAEFLKRIRMYIELPTHEMWTHLKNEQILEDLAEYALLFTAIPPSESAVERTYSTIRKYLETRQSAKNDLINAYISAIPQSCQDVSDEETNSDDCTTSDVMQTPAKHQTCMTNYFNKL